MTTTTTVRIAVARFEFTPSIPILAKIEVNAANNADSIAKKNHMYIRLQSYKSFLLIRNPSGCFIRRQGSPQY